MNMTKTTIISILLLAIVGTGIFFLGKKQNTESEMMNTDQEETVETSEAEGKKMAFTEFLKQDKGAYQCTVNQYIDEEMTQTTQGLVYVYDGNISGNFETDAMGMNITSSMIVRDGYSYTWSNMSPVGYKVAIVESPETNTNQEISGTYSWKAEQIGDYDCELWEVDMTKFDLPEGISFQ